jgi:hypothetical protein
MSCRSSSLRSRDVLPGGAAAPRLESLQPVDDEVGDGRSAFDESVDASPEVASVGCADRERSSGYATWLAALVSAGSKPFSCAHRLASVRFPTPSFL